MPKKVLSIAGLEFKLDDKNPRAHGERSKRLLKKSLQMNGSGRSIVANAETLTIVNGNNTIREAVEQGFKFKVVEQQPDEIIIALRHGLSPAQERHLALADNASARADAPAEAWDAVALESDRDTAAVWLTDDDAPGYELNLDLIGSESELDDGEGVGIRPKRKPQKKAPLPEVNYLAPEAPTPVPEPAPQITPDAKYPLSIVLTRKQKFHWDGLKTRLGYKSDIELFLHLTGVDDQQDD